MPPDSIRQKCQAAWLRCLADRFPLVFQFPTAKDAERAKFAFYDATRRSADPRLQEAREAIELSLDRRAFTITLRPRALNPFYETMENTLDKGLPVGQPSTTVAPAEDIEDAVQASLARFEKLRKEGEAGERPRNPYFDRQED